MDKKFIALGMALGLVFGAATDHIGMGFALGLVIGTAIAAAKAKRVRRAR